MNYGDLKARLRGLINRSDMTDELAAQFVTMAQARLDRWPQVDPLKYAPRPAFQEKYVRFTLEPDEFNPGSFKLPNDFLQILSLHCEDVEAERVSTSKFIKYPSTASGVPTVFMQAGHLIHLRPVPPEGTMIYMLYFGTVSPLEEDTDQNAWTVSASDALLYGAAAYAADYFEDERFPRFETRFKEALLELQDQTINESLSGSMVMAGAYTYPQDEI